MPIKYRPPAKTGFTIYKITGCKYCDMALKHLAKAKNLTIINCDKYMQGLRNRDEFFKYMCTYTIIPYQYFPMIFYNSKFIGGYGDLIKVKKLVMPFAKHPAKHPAKQLTKHSSKPQYNDKNHKNNTIKQGS